MMKLAMAGAILSGLISNAIAREDAANLYEIYEYGGRFTLDAPPPEMKPIVLQIPRGFGYASSGKATRTWGFNILTYYPKFTNPEAPENRAFGLSCRGDCNGRVLIGIENRAHSINNLKRFDSPNMGDYIARVEMERRTPLGAKKNDLEPLHGFDSGYEVRLPATNSISDRAAQYFFHFGPDKKHYDIAAKCSLNEFARTCTLHFSLKCNPAIYVQVVAIDMKHIDAWADIVQRVDKFVSSMVRDPVCT